MKNLKEASAFEQKSPYEIYQEWEEIPVHKLFIVEDLLALKLGDWQRNGVRQHGWRWRHLRHRCRRDRAGREPQAHATYV